MATDFPGTGTYLDITDGAPFYITTGWTISLWMYWDSVSNGAYVIGHGFDGNYLPIAIGIGTGGSEGTAGAVFAGFYNGTESPNWKSASEGVSPPLGQWVHYGARWTPGDGVYLFRNGKQSAYFATASTPIMYSGTRAFRVGISFGGTSIDAKIDRLAIWDRALPTERITYLSKDRAIDPRTVLPSSQVGYWRMEGGPIERNLAIDRGYSTSTNFTPATGSTGLPTPWPAGDLNPSFLIPFGGLASPEFSPPFLNIGVGLFTPELLTQLFPPFLNIGVGLSPPVLTDDPVLPPFVPPPLPPTLGTGSGGGTVPVGPGVPLPPLSSGGLAGIRFYQGPPWRWLVTDLAGASITFLDHLAVEAEVTYTLNKPWEARLTMPADNPEVNIPHTDGDPFVSEGNRLLYGFRREGETPKWVCRFAGKVLQVEDTGETEDARTVITAWDSWQILYQRPMVNYNDEFPDQTAPKTGGPGTFFSFDDTQVGGIAGLFLRNTIINQGDVHIDMGDTTPTWSTDGPPTFNPVVLPGTTYWGGPYTAVWSGRTKSLFQTTTQVDCDTQQGLMVGEVWDQMLEYGSLDLMLTPIYDPLRRPGITSELSIYNRVGAPQYDAVFAWDKPGRNVKAFNSLRDGTKRANTIRYYSEQGGPPVGGGIPISDGTSILKYEETWHEQFWVGRIQSAAFAMAELQLELLANGIHTVEITPAPERMPFAFTEWFLGDTVPVYTSNKAREENIGFQRIYGIVLNIDENSYEQVPQVLASPDSA